MPRSPPSFSLRPAPAVAMLWRGKSPRQATVPSSAFIRFRRDEKENYDLRNLLFNAWFLGCSIHFLKLFALAPGHSQPERQVKSSLPCFFTTSASRRMSPRWSVCRSFLLSAYITPAKVLPAASRAL